MIRKVKVPYLNHYQVNSALLPRSFTLKSELRVCLYSLRELVQSDRVRHNLQRFVCFSRSYEKGIGLRYRKLAKSTYFTVFWAILQSGGPQYTNCTEAPVGFICIHRPTLQSRGRPVSSAGRPRFQACSGPRQCPLAAHRHINPFMPRTIFFQNMMEICRFLGYNTYNTT